MIIFQWNASNNCRSLNYSFYVLQIKKNINQNLATLVSFMPSNFKKIFRFCDQNVCKYVTETKLFYHFLSDCHLSYFFSIFGTWTLVINFIYDSTKEMMRKCFMVRHIMKRVIETHLERLSISFSLCISLSVSLYLSHSLSVSLYLSLTLSLSLSLSLYIYIYLSLSFSRSLSLSIFLSFSLYLSLILSLSLSLSHSISPLFLCLRLFFFQPNFSLLSLFSSS